MLNEYDKIILLDTETTGVDFEKDQIIELAAIVMERKNGSLTATKKYDQFIKLHKLDKLPNEIVELTHITDELLHKYGREEKDIAEEYLSLITDNKTLIIAHNTQFDINMIYQMLKRVYGSKKAIEYMEKHDYLDTQTIIKDRKEFPHTLETSIEYYDLEDKCRNSHRAIDDVIALTYVTNSLAKERNDLDLYVNVFGYNPKYRVDGLTFHFIKYKKQFLNKQIVSEDKILPLQN